MHLNLQDWLFSAELRWGRDAATRFQPFLLHQSQTCVYRSFFRDVLPQSVFRLYFDRLTARADPPGC